MKNRFLKYSTIVAVVLVLAGCPSVAIRNVKEASLGNKGKSLEEVGQAIKRAGRGLGWVMKDEGEGKIKGTVVRRQHSAEVMITYNTNTYSIDLVGSSNLKYDAQEKTIHRNYNIWVSNLEKAIRIQMSE